MMSRDLLITVLILGAALVWAGWRLGHQWRHWRRGTRPTDACSEGCTGASCRIAPPAGAQPPPAGSADRCDHQ
jgi:hypothetical protein